MKSSYANIKRNTQFTFASFNKNCKYMQVDALEMQKTETQYSTNKKKLFPKEVSMPKEPKKNPFARALHNRIAPTLFFFVYGG